MPTVIFSNLKGGVGKTTLADQTAYILEGRGYDVGYYDLDGQGGQAHESASDEHEWQIVDMPGRLDGDTLSTVAQADLVVVPYNADMLNYEPTKRYIDAVKRRAPRVGVLYVMNAFDKGAADQRNFAESGALPADVTVPHSRVIVKAENAGEPVASRWSWTAGARALQTLADEITKRTER